MGHPGPTGDTGFPGLGFPGNPGPKGKTYFLILKMTTTTNKSKNKNTKRNKQTKKKVNGKKKKVNLN